MTVRDLIKKENGNYSDYEVWMYSDGSHKLHTDYIKNIDGEYSKSQYFDAEAVNYEIMDCNEYNNTILANCEPEDFSEIYGDDNAKVLVIMLDYDWDTPREQVEEVTDEKIKLANLLISLPGFDGIKDATALCENYTEQQLKDALEAYGFEFSDAEYSGTELEITESQIKSINKYVAQEKYDKNNTQHISLKLNKNTDSDIIEWLDRQSSKQGAIKNAIKKAMQEGK